MLQVSNGFITQSNQRYDTVGIEGLKLNYWGTAGYLNPQQKQELVAMWGQKDCWTLEEGIEHIEDHYGVVYQSHQSYYTRLCCKNSLRTEQSLQSAHQNAPTPKI